jgi:hypothetical protein
MRYSELGFTEFSEMRVVPEVKVVDYDYEDIAGTSGSGSTLKIPVGADTLILEVCHEVVDDFTGASTLQIGDSGDTDEFIATSQITLGSVGDFASSKTGSADAKAGKKFNSVDQVKLTFDATPTAGEGRVYLWFIPSTAATWRKPAAGSTEYAAGKINS